eukprot:224820_1
MRIVQYIFWNTLEHLMQILQIIYLNHCSAFAPFVETEHKYKLKRLQYGNSIDVQYLQQLTEQDTHWGKYDYLFKIVPVGDVGVGKQSFLTRYENGTFPPIYTRIPVDVMMRTIEMESKTIKLQMWRTSGVERFKNITRSYYRRCHGILLCYDITHKESFENVSKWNEEIEIYGPTNVCKILIGTNLDLNNRRQVSYNEGKDLATKLNILHFMETSAKTGENVEKAMLLLAEQILFTMSGE